jgi:uncharacterized alkaline shock family protein YloU
VEAARTLPTPLGRITIASDSVAQIAAHTAAECYGVVGMTKGGRAARLLPRERRRRGVEVVETPAGLRLALRVVVEYGLNLAEVAATLRSRVAYEVERLTGLTVAEVEVHIGDLRRSA